MLPGYGRVTINSKSDWVTVRLLWVDRVRQNPMISLCHVENCLIRASLSVLCPHKKVCSALQNSPVLPGGCKFLMYIRGRGLHQVDPLGWSRISKVWLFWALDPVPLMLWPWVRPYVTSHTYAYLRLPVRLIVEKGKYGSFVGKLWKQSYPGIGFEWRWVVLSQWKMNISSTSWFSPGNEKPVTWLGHGRVRKTHNMTRLLLDYDKLVTWLGHSRLVLSCSGKPKSLDLVIQCEKLPYPGLRVRVVPGSKKLCSALQNSPILLGGCKFLRYIRGRGLLREDPLGWDKISKLWMFWALDTAPLVSWPQVRPYVMSQMFGYLRLPVQLIVRKGKYGSFVVKWWKQCYPGLRFERSWVDGSRWESKNSNTSEFSMVNEKVIPWLGHSQVWKPIMWPRYCRVTINS
jgi:hypothetical protein